MSLLAAPLRLVRSLRKPGPDANTAQFMRFCRAKWPAARRAKSDSVALVGQFAWRPSICVYAYFANYLADKTGSRIEACSFGRRRDTITEDVYRSFGAETTLGWDATKQHAREARRIADETFARLASKEEVLAISIGGLVVGDLIYDTYLRYYLEPTVDLRDERLRHTIERAALITLACDGYFSRNRVVAYIAYDAPYIESGIPHRFALRHRVPIYAVEYNPLTVHTMDSEFSGDDLADHRNWPSKVVWGSHQREYFASLSHAEQERARAAAREQLSARLAGKVDTKLLPHGASAFAEPGEERLLNDGDKPRILVMLHDFCDAPNVLSWSLFSDCYEWLDFLLSRASATDFEWYVKPHPHRHFDRQKGMANDAIVERFQARYPKIRFLSPAASNRQIIREGVRAMFTIHGTAAHEFAYHGISVVNAGYNHHIEYGFNFHPRTVEELAALIASADALELSIDKAEIEEFFYLHYLHPLEQADSGVNFIPEEWRHAPNAAKIESGTEIYQHVAASDSPERDEKIRLYLDGYFARSQPPCLVSSDL